MHLRPVQFVDTPIDRDGEVARLAGGMQWFAAYEVIEESAKRTVSIAEFEKTLNANDERAARLHAAITAPRAPLSLGARTLRFDQPIVAGILNVTPDSFSGDTHSDPVAAGVAMAAAGAALIDVGGESTRPNAELVWEGDEVKRVEPVVRGLAKAGTLVSIDTRKAAVMEAALGAGAALVNDVAALLWDDRALDVVAEPLVARGVAREEARDKASALLARLNLPERLWSLPPATFSGGEQQRVNIARGFITDHPVLLLDEPTASLDATNRGVVVEMIAEKKAAGTAMLGIFHDDDVRSEVA